MSEADRGDHPAPLRLIRAVLWRRRDEPACEIGRLMASTQGYVLDGRVHTLVDGAATEAGYAVHCGLDWITRYAEVYVVAGVSARRTVIRRDEAGRWRVNDRHVPEFDGIPDIDLAFSPATNTLPIHRLALRIGESQAVDAVWVRFPELSCERLSQRYTRLGDLHYRYESSSPAFRTDVHVDEEQVVTRYGEIWERVTG